MFIELEHINHGDHSIYQYRFPVDAHADLLGMTQHSGGGDTRGRLAPWFAAGFVVMDRNITLEEILERKCSRRV
jgi:hypothetical protein